MRCSILYYSDIFFGKDLYSLSKKILKPDQNIWIIYLQTNPTDIEN